MYMPKSLLFTTTHRQRVIYTCIHPLHMREYSLHQQQIIRASRIYWHSSRIEFDGDKEEQEYETGNNAMKDK